ncbi:MAG TPA: ABC transporter substrate-binding protein [Ktedonosporobacter sp.]|nr:ABC transporter substrate-binding protein [Ktedonosporobacter sp.]
MHIAHDRSRNEVDRLLDVSIQQRLSRRVFLQYATAIGLSASVATTLLAACSGEITSGLPQPSPAAPTAIDVLNVWSGEEQDSFRAVVAPFTKASKITVNIEATRDLNAALTTRLRGNSPPDIAILPNPGQMQQLAAQNKLVRLDSFLDMSKLRQDYRQPWIDLGSYNGGLYALFYKIANKGTVWYNPGQFQALGVQTPTTWTAMLALSDKIAAAGKYPWSMGVDSAASSGWPATDWIAEIYLNQSGPEMYDQWWQHKIPWTHESVKSAFQMLGQIAGGKHYVSGAPQSILETSFQDACYQPFASPPTAYMCYLADFAAGFITSHFPSARPGTDFDFFAFPSIDPRFQGEVTIGADVVVAMKDNDAVRKLITYLATSDAQSIWVKRGGFTSANRSVDLAAYPNPVAQSSFKMLTNASNYKFGAGDLMPPAVQTAFWKGALTFIADQKQLDSVLSSIEAIAKQAYGS